MTQLTGAIPPGIDAASYLNWLAQMQAWQQQNQQQYDQQQRQQDAAAAAQQQQLLMQLLQQGQSRYEDARAANEQRRNEILAGRTDTRNRILDHWNNYGDSLINDTNRGYQTNLNNSLAALYDSGLGQSTVNASIRARNEKERQDSLRRVKDDIIGNYANADERLSNNIDEFNERITDTYPDSGVVGQLAGKLGGIAGLPLGSSAPLPNIGSGRSTVAPAYPQPSGPPSKYYTNSVGARPATPTGDALTGPGQSRYTTPFTPPTRPVPQPVPVGGGSAPAGNPYRDMTPELTGGRNTFSGGRTVDIEPRGNVNRSRPNPYGQPQPAKYGANTFGAGMNFSTTPYSPSLPQLSAPPQLPAMAMPNMALAQQQAAPNAPAAAPAVPTAMDKQAQLAAAVQQASAARAHDNPAPGARLPWQAHPTHWGSGIGLDINPNLYQPMPALGIFGANAQLVPTNDALYAMANRQANGASPYPYYQANGGRSRPRQGFNPAYQSRIGVIPPGTQRDQFLKSVGAGGWYGPDTLPTTNPYANTMNLTALMKLFTGT